MEIYMPSKEEWDLVKRKISDMAEGLQQFKELLKKGNLSGEHFPEYMDMAVAAEYLKCPVSRIKSMVYKQKILSLHHIDLTSTVYVSKKEIDDLKYRVPVFQKMHKKIAIK